MSPWLAFLPLIVAYATALWWCGELWTIEGGYFAHGPLVPVVMAWVFWSRRASWSQQPLQVDRRGWLLLGPALLMHLCGAALTIDSLSAVSMVLAVPGAAWLLLGLRRLRGLWPALWVFAFAVPMPLYVTGRLAFELKELAVQGGVMLGQLTGLAIRRDGASLFVPGQDAGLDVADPCGGLRSLLAMITLVYCLACFTGPRTFGRRAVLLAVAAPLALFVNMLRIAAICWVASGYGVEFASGIGHDVLNALAWVVDLALILVLDGVVTRRLSRGAAVAAAEPAPAAPWTPRLQVVALWVAAVPLLFLSLYRPNADVGGRADALPALVGDFVQIHEEKLDGPRYLRLLGTEDGTWRVYAAADGQPVWVVGVFHANNWKSIHPPHVCLLGSNMEVLEDSEEPWPAAETPDTATPTEQGTFGRILLRTRDHGRPYLSLYAYGARDLRTGSYLEFFLHHAPRALFRSSNDGFLLRVETFADGEGGVAAAEARCRRLLRSLFDESRGLLP